VKYEVCEVKFEYLKGWTMDFCVYYVCCYSGGL
jgi:hypothetical protein